MGYRGILLLAWLFAGPVAADTLPVSIVRIVVNPSTPATLYAAAGTTGTDQGVYKSTDGGLSWTRVFAMADAPRGLAIDPLTSSTLYVADAGANLPASIYKSTDGGATWNAASSGILPKPGITPLQVDVIDQVLVNPVDEGVVYAAANNTGLYKSTDGGQSWTGIDQGLPLVIGMVPISGSLTVDPVVPTTLYYSLLFPAEDVGLYQSTDGGATWNPTSLNDYLNIVSGLAIDPRDHLHLLACLGTVFESSTDGGATWAATGASCSTLGSVTAMDPYYPDHLLIGSFSDKTIRSSVDGGATFGASVLSGQQIKGLVFDPEVPTNVYAVTASGLYISRDDGATWTFWSSPAARVAPVHVPADKATIQAGIDAAPNADYVIVAPGTYYEQLDFKGKLITVKSSGGAAATILDGNSTGPIVKFHNGESHAAVLQGFTLTHASNNPGAGSAILLSGASPSIEDDVFRADQENNSTGSAISGSNTSALILRDYFTANSCGTGATDAVVSFTSNSSPIVADDVFADNPCAAYAQTIAAATASQVYNDTFVDNTEALRLSGYAATDTAVTFTQNIIVFNQVGVHTLGYSGTTMPAFSFNLVYGDTTADYAGVHDQTDGYINISADPLLVNWVDGDYHLQWGSPALFSNNTPDLGLPQVVQASATDFYGQPRFIFSFGSVLPVSLGAAEYQPPVIDAEAGVLQVALDTPQTGTLVASATDPAGPVIFAVVSSPAHGQLTLTDSSGGYKYVPATGYVGSDGFTFTVEDSAYGTVSAPATVQVTVSDVAATVHDGTASTKPGTTVTGTLSATTFAGQDLAYAIVSGPSHGMVTLGPVSGQFHYTPAPGYIGSDSFSFHATDQHGSVTNTATEQLSIADVAATADAGNIGTSVDTAVLSSLAATRAYPAQQLSFSAISDPAHGALSLDPATGSFTYTPAQGYVGADSFMFEVTDGFGMVSNMATEKVVVDDVAPTADGGSTGTAPGVVVAGTLSATSAYSGQTLSFNLVSSPSHGLVTLTAATGKFSYRPALGFSGTDSFTFSVTDQHRGVSNAATEQVTVTDVAPTASDGGVSTTPDTTVSAVAAAQAGYAGQVLQFSLVSPPAHGSVSLGTNGRFRYIPATGYAGADSFTFKATDPIGSASNLGTETVTVKDVAPLASASHLSAPANSSRSGTLGSVKAYTGQALSYQIVAAAAHGSVAITDASTGAYTYTPSAGFKGSDAFTFQVTDQWGTASKTATVSIRVQ